MKKKYPSSKCVIGKNNVEICIIKEFCKGCGICVEFCPKDVLGLGKDLKVEVINIDACTGDRLCELRCPDLAIFVHKRKEG
ncbi:MAG: 4Fe-4S binding protein [candidate division WOR-3 bacterium]|nr:4Fe-4S binding protein [candidate division WOR-3 bacterium]MCX7757453.1 4Fe-4S binding protein [candidate division WOR-3 bacterium]MDW7987906.1 4Fe-4S binding protein [candidate division WOR-3 bacterium]